MDDRMHEKLQGRRRKNELLFPGPGLEIRSGNLQKVDNQAKLPGIILKGLFLALAVALMPVLHKQSPQLIGYANHATIARSWELINLVVIGLAISYGFISRRQSATENANDNHDRAVAAQGAQNYVQKIFDFAEVFDNFCLPAATADDKLEAWSSRWQPQEPLVFKEKPLLLPIRSLKSSLSNPEVLEFFKEGEVPSSKPAPAAAAVDESGKPPEVRNGTILSVESGNFDEEISNVIASEDSAVFPSPIPWASRLDVLNNMELHPLVPAVVNLASDDGKIDPPAIPSPIPWRSRPDRSVLPDHEGKHKIPMENGDVSDSKPPLPPPQRPPPPPPETQKKSIQRGVSPSSSPLPSPRPSPSPPRPRSMGLVNGDSQKNMQASSGISLQKFPSPRPSPSPPRPRSLELANDNSQKNLQASSGIRLQKFPTPRPSPSPPRHRSHPAPVENGSSQTNPNPKFQNSNEVSQATQNDSVKDPTASAAPSFPTVAENGSSEKHHINGKLSISKFPQPTPFPPVLQDSADPKEPMETTPAYTSNSRSKSGDDRSYLRGKGRECLSSRSNSRSKIRETSADSSKNGRDCEEAEQAARASTKLPSLPPLPGVPPIPPAPLNPDVSTTISAPLPPPPPYGDHASYSHDELNYENTSSSSEVLYQGEDSISESEKEVDKKADQFIAKFHEQIRLQRLDSIRRSQERHERKGGQ